MIDVALFGAGRIGKIHAGNVVRQPGVRLKYVVDVDSTAAMALGQQYGAQVTSADAVFTDASVRVVVIASSTMTSTFGFDFSTFSAAAAAATWRSCRLRRNK